MRLRSYFSCTLIATLLLFVAPGATLAQGDEPSLTSLPYVAIEGGNMFVKARINGTEVTLLLDTGAESTLITEKTARRLKLKTSARKQATSPSVHPLVKLPPTKIVTADVFEMGELRYEDVPLVVYDQKRTVAFRDQPMDGILGMNVLFYFALALDPVKEQFTLILSGNLTPATLQRLGFGDVKPQPML